MTQHYIAFPSHIRVGSYILRHRIIEIAGDGSDCIAYKVRDDDGQIKVLKECYPHAMNPEYPESFATRDVNGCLLYTSPSPRDS